MTGRQAGPAPSDKLRSDVAGNAVGRYVVMTMLQKRNAGVTLLLVQRQDFAATGAIKNGKPVQTSMLK